MANIQEIKTRISLDGETAFKQALKSIDANMKILANETKIISNSFDKSKASIKNYIDLNAALSKQIEQQKIKVNALKTAVSDSNTKYQQAKEKQAAVTKEYGKNSEEAQKAARGTQAALNALMKYQSKLSAAEAALSKMNKEYRNNAESIEQLSNAQNEASSKTSTGSEQLMKFATTAGKAVVAVKLLTTAVSAVSNAVKTISSAAIQGITKDVEISTKAFQTYYKTALQAAEAVSKTVYETGSSFQAEMSKVQAYSGLDKMSGEFKSLTDAAAETGKMTARTATEAAQALGYMALAGYDTNKMLAGLNPLVLASEAGLMDMKTCSDLVTDSMSVLGMQADEMARFLDVATAAQNNSNTSLQQFLEALIPVGGTMKELNVPLEETASLIGVLSNRGNKGSEAGHKLNSVLVNLIGANKNAKTALTDLGVSAWNSDGSFKGITETLIELDKALQGVSDEEKVNFEAKIGGKLQMDTLQKLIAGVKNEYSELNEVVTNSNGTLEKTANTMYDNVSGSFTYLKSAIDGLKTEAFNDIAEPLKDVADKVTYYIQLIAQAYESGGIEGATKFFTGYFKNNHLDKFISEIEPQLTSAYEKFQTSYDKIFLAGVDSAAKIIPKALPKIMGILQSSFSNVTQGLVPYAQTAINTAATVIINGIPTVVTTFNTAFINALSSIDIPGTISRLAEDIATQAPLFIQSAFSLLNSFISALYQIITSEDLATVAGQIVSSLIDNIINSGAMLIETASVLVDRLLTGIIEYAPKMIQGASQLLTNLINAITANVEKLSIAAVEIVVGLVELIADNVEPLVNCAIQLISYLAEKLVTADNLKRLVDAGLKIISGLVRGVIDAAPVLLKAISNIIRETIQYLLSGDWFNSIVNTLSDIIGNIIPLLGELFMGAFDIIGSGFEGLTDGIKNATKIFNSSSITEWWGSFTSGFKNGANSFIETSDNIMNDLMSEEHTEKVIDVSISANVENTDEISDKISLAIDTSVSNVNQKEIKPKFTLAYDFEEFNKQTEKLNAVDSQFQFFSDSSTGDVFNMISSNQVDNTKQLQKLDERLASIENLLNQANMQIEITNHLFPNAETLGSTLHEINMMNNVVTGGR